jgi:sugar lactone lactonase YvrE
MRSRNFVGIDLAEGKEHSETRSQYCRGMATDEAGNIYIAVTGSRCVVKVDKNIEATVLLRAEQPWSPTGVDVHGGSLYVLEYNDEKPVEGRAWPLRVRKLHNGHVSTLVAIRGQ